MNVIRNVRLVAVRAPSRVYFATVLAALAACSNSGPDGFSGTVQAPSAAVGSTIGGTVSAVRVRDGSRVRAGDVIVEFDAAQESAAYQNALASAQSAQAASADLAAGSRAPDLGRAQALAQQQRQIYRIAQLTASKQIAQLDDQIRQADANVATARAAAREAQIDAARQRTLAATGDISAQNRDAAVSRAGQTQGQLAAASAAAASARKQRENAAEVTLPRETTAALEGYRAAEQAYHSLAVGARPNALAQARASAAAASANAADAKARLDQMTVRAPAAGLVSALDLHVGDLVAPGASVATIDEDGEPFVRVYVPQSQLSRWQVGAAVTVHPDSSPGTKVTGSIEAVDAQAQFTPQNVQTADDRAKLSFGVKVRIHDRDHPLHGGTTATVYLP
jgi:HlyD family secretion protein